MSKAQTVVVDPITRIEGHLRIEAETDATTASRRASSAGTMVRGIEIILRGRDPRDAWAFAQRICGVCTLVHGIASVRAVEDALNYELPPNAQLIRNLMIARAVRARPCDAFLPPACAGLGRRGLGAEGRSQSDLGRWRSRSPPIRNPRPAISPTCRQRVKSFVAVRPARHLRQRLLGPSRLQAAAGSQPDGGGALPRCAGLAARSRATACHLRRQESASEFPGRRRAVRDQHPSAASGPGQRPALADGGAAATAVEHGRAGNRAEHHPADAAISSTRCMCPTRSRSPRFYKDWFTRGGGYRQLHDLRRFPGEGHAAIHPAS